MLSPGQWYKKVPKDRAKNLIFRQRVLRLCREHAWARKAALEACKQDILFFINVFCFTYRPKAGGTEQKVIPFITWDCQDTSLRFLVEHIDRQREAVAEKSRDMGWSWLCCYTADWLWRFHEWTKTGMFSRVGELVDSKDPDSLFWKIRFVQPLLPSFLWPKGWNPRLHDTSMYRENPETHSVITGQATTKDMGVAGRCTWAVFDEFSRVPNAKSVLDNTKDTSDCRVFVSTHTGPGTTFHSLCNNGVTDKIVSHWSHHPEKAKGLYRYHPETNRVEVLDTDYQFPQDYQFVKDGTPTGGPEKCLRSPWYDEQCKTRSRADVRTNLDIDVAGSMSQFFDAALINRLIAATASEPFWKGDVEDGRLVRTAEGRLRLWSFPDSEGKVAFGRYAIGVDVAAGTGASPSCVSLVNADTGEKVGAYVNPHLEPKELAPVVFNLGRLFRRPEGLEARVAWEASGSVGESFGKKLLEMGYRNVWYRETPMSYAGVRASSDKPGWYNSSQTLGILLGDYQTALEKRGFINHAEDALKECLMFRYNEAGDIEHPEQASPDDPSGARVNHGDRVIADALAWMVCLKLGMAKAEPEPERDPIPYGSLAWRQQINRRELEEAEA